MRGTDGAVHTSASRPHREKIVSILFNVLLHGLLLGSMGIFLFGIVKGALTNTDPFERLLRVAALFAGAMISLGAQASGVDYANFTVDALAGARPASAAANTIATVIPALMGAAIGFYVSRQMGRNDVFATRIMGFVGVLAATAFLQVYAEAANRNGLELGRAALPNIAFTAGVILTVVFTADQTRNTPESRGTFTSLATGLLQRRQESRAAFHVPRQTSDSGRRVTASSDDPFESV